VHGADLTGLPPQPAAASRPATARPIVDAGARGRSPRCRVATTSGSGRSKRARLDRHRSFHRQAAQRETLAPWTSAEWAATLRWSGRGRWPAQFGVLSRRSRRNSSISAVAAACRCFAVVGMVLADQVRNASW